MVYNSVPWSQQAEIFIYMTDWGADLGIVSAITSPRVRTHSYISLLFSHFHLKYVEQKRKKKSPNGGGPPTKSIKSSIKISSLTL